MKKLFLALVVLTFSVCVSAGNERSYKEQYRNLVDRVGLSGLGVKSLIDRWRSDSPDDGEMLRAHFSYWFSESMSREVVSRNAKKFMGADPVFELKDSLGNPVPYFLENVFVDSLFEKSLTFLDRAIELYPLEFSYRAEKFTALMSYEKENPSSSVGLALNLIDEYKSHSNLAWTVFGQPATPQMFCLQIQDFCYCFFHIGSDGAYEAFYRLASRMNRLFPSDEIFLGDLGTYWLVAREDTKKARRYYQKLLKINPANEIAVKNLAVIERIEAENR